MATPRPQQISAASAKRRDQLEAGVTGGGIGTAIAGFASVVQDHFWKQCLILAAPSIGIAAAALYGFVVRMYVNPWIRDTKNKMMLSHWAPILNNQNLSAEFREKLKDQLEQKILANMSRYDSD
jgi:hypothetical protein